MTEWATQRVKAPDSVMVREVEGESILLNSDGLEFFGLDDVGTRMWSALTEAESIQQAYETLLDEYEVAPDVLRADLQALLDQLMQHGLVELV